MPQIFRICGKKEFYMAMPLYPGERSEGLRKAAGAEDPSVARPGFEKDPRSELDTDPDRDERTPAAGSTDAPEVARPL